MTIDWDKLEKEREAEARLARTRTVPVYRPARPMGAAVVRALRPILKEAGPSLERLKSTWTEAVGLTLAKHCTPEKISKAKGGSVLYLRASSAVAPIIEHSKERILERASLATGKTIVDIRVIQTTPPKQLALVIPRPLTPEQREALVKRLAPVQNRAVRNALAQLGEAVLTGQRKA